MSDDKVRELEEKLKKKTGSRYVKSICHEWLLDNFLRFVLTAEERSVYWDMLNLSMLNNPTGQINFLTTKQLAQRFVVDEKIVKETLEKCKRFKKVRVKFAKNDSDESLIILNDFLKHTSDYWRQKPYRKKKQAPRGNTVTEKVTDSVTEKVTPKVTARIRKRREGELEGEGEKKRSLQDDLSIAEKSQKSSKPQKKKLPPIKDFSELVEEEKNKITPSENLPLPKAMKFDHRDEAVEFRAEIGQITKNINYIDECLRDGKNKDNHPAMKMRKEKYINEREKLRRQLSELYQLYR